MHSLVLRDLSGQPTKQFLVSSHKLTFAPSSKRQVAHHIVLIDRSGSMWDDIASVRAMVEKVAVLEEYRDSGLLMSVISYSSRGDYTTHFQRIPVSEVLKPGSPYVEQIRSIRSTGLTCMSQAVEVGISFVRLGEPTILTLHSDGYANDTSPAEEKRKIETLLDLTKKVGFDLAMDTVAYSDRSDFRLLLSFSERMGGRCVVARSAKDVYDALLETQKRLAEGTVPSHHLPATGPNTQILFVSRSAGKILLSEEGQDLVVHGLKPDDDATVHLLTHATEVTGAFRQPLSDLGAIYALSAALLAKGQIRAAKEALCATQDHTYQTHWRALSRTDIEAFYTDMMAAVMGDPVNRPRTNDYGVLASGPVLVDLFDVLAQHKKDIQIDVPALVWDYRLRSVRRISGSRDEQGNLVMPPVAFDAVDEGLWTRISGVQLSNANATMNLRVVRKGRLRLLDGVANSNVEEAQVDGHWTICSVAGIPLADRLFVYRNYTIVSDGSVHAKKLRIKVGSKAAWRDLERIGAVTGTYDHTQSVQQLYLGECPVVDFRRPVQVAGLSAAVRLMLMGKMVSSIFRAMSSGTSSRFSDQQISALASVCVTPGLNVSMPTTTPYTDKDQALAEGIIDVEVGTKVELGLHDVLPSQLPSANDFLARHFTVVRGGVEVKGPKFIDVLEPDAVVVKKELSSRSKPAVTDAMFLPLFEDLFGASNGAYEAFFGLGQIGVDDAGQLQRFLPSISTNARTRLLDKDARVELVEKLKEKVDEALEGVLASQIRPLVFWVGATGALPEGAEAPPLSAEQAKEKSPSLKVSKKLEDATFYFLPDGVLLAAIPEEKYYSTGKLPIVASEEAEE